MWVLCISTSEQVLRTPFAGQNHVFNISNYKVGRNLMVNRFKILNNKIDYSWLNASFETFKIKCKSLLL